MGLSEVFQDFPPDTLDSGYAILIFYFIVSLIMGIYLYNFAISDKDNSDSKEIINDMLSDLSTSSSSSSSTNGNIKTMDTLPFELPFIDSSSDDGMNNNSDHLQHKNQKYSCKLEKINEWKNSNEKIKLIEDSFRYPLHKSNSFKNLCDCDFIDMPKNKYYHTKESPLFFLYHRPTQPINSNNDNNDHCHSNFIEDINDIVDESQSNIDNDQNSLVIDTIKSKSDHHHSSLNQIDKQVLSSSLAVQPNSESPPEQPNLEKTLEI